MQISTQQPISEAYPLADLIDDVLRRIKQAGASDAEVSASIAKGFATTVRMGEIDTLEHTRDQGFDITVYFGKQKGHASSNDFSLSAIDEAIQAACAIAKYIEADPYNGLPERELLCASPVNLDLYHPVQFTPEQAIELARETEALGLQVSDKICNSEGASFSQGEAHHIIANSLGFMGAYPTSRYSLSCCLIAEGNTGIERDYEYTTSRMFNKLLSSQHVAEKAAEKVLGRLNARRIKTCKVPVLFTPELTRGLIGTFVGAISGSSIYRHASFLCDHLAKPVFAPWVNLTESPHMPQALGSAAFDAEGVATPASRRVVEAGVLQNYVMGCYSARRLGLQTTANAGGVHNLQLAPTVTDVKDLLAMLNRGLWVTELIGHGINLVTGDYSRGAAGFWVENGEIQYPVSEITIAGNLRDMFAHCVAASGDIDTRGRIHAGSLLLAEMTVAGA